MPTTSLRTRKIRERLEAKRSALLARYKGELERADELATVPPEMVETATDQWDARLLSALSDVDARALESVIAAIRRVDAGTYGVCMACGNRIEPARLEALPEAADCLDCVKFAEETPARWVMSIDEAR